jgi:hypothetical protein
MASEVRKDGEEEFENGAFAQRRPTTGTPQGRRG